MDELQRLQADAGLVSESTIKKQQQRLEWMYDPGAAAKYNVEEDTLKTMNKGVSDADASKQMERLSQIGQTDSGSMFVNDPTATTGDTVRKLYEDPFFKVLKAQQAQREKVINNPIIRQRVLDAMRKQKEDAKARSSLFAVVSQPGKADRLEKDNKQKKRKAKKDKKTKKEKKTKKAKSEHRKKDRYSRRRRRSESSSSSSASSSASVGSERGSPRHKRRRHDEMTGGQDCQKEAATDVLNRPSTSATALLLNRGSVESGALGLGSKSRAQQIRADFREKEQLNQRDAAARSSQGQKSRLTEEEKAKLREDMEAAGRRHEEEKTRNISSIASREAALREREEARRQRDRARKEELGDYEDTPEFAREVEVRAAGLRGGDFGPRDLNDALRARRGGRMKDSQLRDSLET